MDTTFTVNGCKNPVTVLAKVLQSFAVVIDDKSFEHAAAICGDVEAPGFVITGYNDAGAGISKLCQLGNVHIYWFNSVVFCEILP